MYKLKLGPEAQQLLDDLMQKVLDGNASVEERKLWKQLGKTFRLLSENPGHRGLHSQKIKGLKQRYPSDDIWESYVENHTPGAKRVFWTFEPDGSIWVHAIDSHPNKARDYRNIQRKFKNRAEEE